MRHMLYIVLCCNVCPGSCLGDDVRELTAGYSRWLAANHDVTLNANITRTYGGDSSFKGLTTSRHAVKLTQTQDSLNVIDELQEKGKTGVPHV